MEGRVNGTGGCAVARSVDCSLDCSDRLVDRRTENRRINAVADGVLWCWQIVRRNADSERANDSYRASGANVEQQARTHVCMYAYVCLFKPPHRMFACTAAGCS